nr:hypothetical protein GCM10020185_81770 [Pseudomonas brassicacearum subsp. brassicacearum]
MAALLLCLFFKRLRAPKETVHDRKTVRRRIFFDPETHTVSYLVLDEVTRQCALIDSVLDYDPKSGRTTTTSADKLMARVIELGAKVEWILETHVHADHLTAAPYLKEKNSVAR